MLYLFYKDSKQPKGYSWSPFINPVLLIMVVNSLENSVDPNQLASKKPADLDLHCFTLIPWLLKYYGKNLCLKVLLLARKKGFIAVKSEKKIANSEQS